MAMDMGHIILLLDIYRVITRMLKNSKIFFCQKNEAVPQKLQVTWESQLDCWCKFLSFELEDLTNDYMHPLNYL